jgi:hypothetical protein
LLIVAVASGTSEGSATSILAMQVSVDGVSWRSDATVQPGQRVLVRTSLSYVGNPTGSALPIGLASVFHQPTVSGWTRGSDAVLPFASFGTNATQGSVSDQPGVSGPFGRISPFAYTGPSWRDPYIGHQQDEAGTSYLRIARASATAWPSLIEPRSSIEGLDCAQRAFPNVEPADPLFLTRITQVIVFKFAVQIGALEGPKTMTVDAPIAGLSRDPLTGLARSTWFSSRTDTYGEISTPIDVAPAFIRVIPSPLSSGVLVLSCAWIRRRRTTA